MRTILEKWFDLRSKQKYKSDLLYFIMEDLEILETELTENSKREEELEGELKEIRDKKYILKVKIAKIIRTLN